MKYKAMEMRKDWWVAARVASRIKRSPTAARWRFIQSPIRGICTTYDILCPCQFQPLTAYLPSDVMNEPQLMQSTELMWEPLERFTTNGWYVRFQLWLGQCPACDCVYWAITHVERWEHRPPPLYWARVPGHARNG
jgi:hypothetical protein